MPKFLVDTDVFVDHLRARRRVPVSPGESAYSTITRAELYAGRSADEAAVDLLLSPFDEVPVDREVSEEAGWIRRAESLTLPDAIVAATALLLRRTLVTRNLKDFKRVGGLRLYEHSR